MADALAHQDHISMSAPASEMVSRVERFQTDSYSVRAQKGINGMDERVTVEWVGLSASQARTVSNQLKAAAVSLVLFTPAPFTDERAYTCESHNITTTGNGTQVAYGISAVLRREYDVLS